MKTILFYFSLIALIPFTSCQKEIRFFSEGTLKKDINNNCQSVTNGSYVAGKNTGSDDYIEVNVHVTAIGEYAIFSDTLNGYSFSLKGDFKDTGLIAVKLPAHGKPMSASIDHFDIHYGMSNCSVDINVALNGNQASFTLQGAPGSCMVDTLFGTYIKSQALDASNKITIAVNVTAPGAYAISSNTVNGYNFSSSGSFAATGAQSITLIASGIPENEGTDVFTLSTGISSCNFSVPVLATVPLTNSDHFPLTKSSYWDYTDLHYHNNIITNIILDSIIKNGILYRAMEEDISPGGPLILNYRKHGSDYFELTAVDKYTSAFQFTKRILDELPFLKENLFSGEQWLSPEYTDIASTGGVVSLQYSYSCLDVTPSVVINGHIFSNVYKVQMKPTMKTVSSNYQDTGETYIFYYARGIGLIYYKATKLNSTIGEWQIKDWQVN